MILFWNRFWSMNEIYQSEWNWKHSLVKSTMLNTFYWCKVMNFIYLHSILWNSVCNLRLLFKPVNSNFILAQVNHFVLKQVSFNEWNLPKWMKWKHSLVKLMMLNKFYWWKVMNFIYFHSIPWNSVRNLNLLLKPVNSNLIL